MGFVASICRFGGVLVFIGTLLLARSAGAASGTWNTTGGSAYWGTSTNWKDGIVADGAGSVASLTYDFTSDLTLDLPTSRTVGTLKLGDLGGINGLKSVLLRANIGVSLTMDNLGGGARIVQVSSSGDNKISVPLLLNDSLTISNESGKSLLISNAITSSMASVNLTVMPGATGPVMFQSGTLDFAGGISTAGILTGTTVIDSVIGSKITQVTHNNAGLLILTGNNKYKGQTSLLSGTLRAMNEANALGLGTLWLEGGKLQLASGGDLAFNRNTTVAGDVVIQPDCLPLGGLSAYAHSLGTLTIGAQRLTLMKGVNLLPSATAGLVFGAVLLTGSAEFEAGSGTRLSLGAVSGLGQAFGVSGEGNVVIAGAVSAETLFKSGPGTVTLSSSNNFNTGLIIASGTVKLGHSQALEGSNPALIINGGGLDANGNNISVGLLSGSTGGVISSQVAGNVKVSISGTGSSAFAGSIRNGAGTVSLSKSGAGTLELTGTSDFTGTTTVSAGKLMIRGALQGTTSVTIANSELNVGGVINPAATVQVSGGGLVSGTGSLGKLTLSEGACLSPGEANAIGQINVASLSGPTGAVLELQLKKESLTEAATAGSNYDQLIVGTGGVSLGGICISISTENIREGDLFFIIYNGGSGSVSGTLVDANGNNLPQMGSCQFGGNQFQISYAGNYETRSVSGGNDVVLLAIPEPDTLPLAGTGLVLLILFRRLFRPSCRADRSAAIPESS